MSNLISQLPEDIKKVALEYQRNETETFYSKETDDLYNAFDWDITTREGATIWNEVYKSNYKDFYKFHNIKPTNKQKQTLEDWCKAKGYNEYYAMIIKQYLEDNEN